MQRILKESMNSRPMDYTLLMKETTVPSTPGRDGKSRSITGVYLHGSSLYCFIARRNTPTPRKFAELRAGSPFICIIGDVFHSNKPQEMHI